MACFCGIDIGAGAAKLLLTDPDARVLAKAVRRSGVDYAATARACLNEALSEAAISESEVEGYLITGYGRDNVPWVTEKATEIACHGQGAYHYFRQAITVIDIGAQDSKVIHLDDRGRRISFKMNRKCAAGTGAFLEEIAYRLDIPLDELNTLAANATKDISLSSFCTVFAATEILEKIRRGERVEDIVKGAFRSVVKRLVEMDTIQGALVLTGGVVAHNPLLAEMAGEAFGTAAQVPPEPQFAGAYGAALFALERSTKGEPRCS
jgi:predicted CoA-substrate-specific enzyme activase